MDREIINKKLPSLKKILHKLVYALGIRKYETKESYKVIIPPEISQGTFFNLISEIAKREDVHTILEIGSSSGQGSTRALFDSLSGNSEVLKQIHCMEISNERFEKLKDYVSQDERFHPHLLSSVKKSDFPDFESIIDFHKNEKTKFQQINIHTIQSWFLKDMEFLTENPNLFRVDSQENEISGIEWIKLNYNISDFDFVIIDGGEFTGLAEYRYLQNAKYFALDDSNTYKNWAVRRELLLDKSYKLVSEDLNERNGWSIFIRA